MSDWDQFKRADAADWDQFKRAESPKPLSLTRAPGEALAAVGKDFLKQTRDAAGAVVRGAGSIGATFMAPQDVLQDWLERRLTGKRPEVSRNEQRRQDMTEAVRTLGADPDSLTFGAFKLGTEVFGTAGAGPALATAGRAVPFLANNAPNVLRAVETAGMTGGGVVPRAAGGAIAGGAAGTMVDPTSGLTSAAVGAAIPGGVKAAGKVGNWVGDAIGGATRNVLGMTTGVGAEPIRQAFKAGATRNQAFLDNMRGDVPLTDVLEQAKAGLAAIRQNASNAYKSGMVSVRNDKTVLDFSGIDKALADAASMTRFKGQVKNPTAAAKIDEMRELVEHWKTLDPAEFHTPEGMDALKQALGGIQETIGINERAAASAAGKVYHAVKGEITKQAPGYAKVMKDYEAASELVKEIERSLVGTKKSSADTAMRKLQSLMRNNVQTNYGNRLRLAEQLEQGGGQDVMPALAGQALNSVMPRSLAGQIGGGATTLTAMATSNPLLALGLPFQSPRLVGSAAYGLGRAVGRPPVNPLALPPPQSNPLAELFLYRGAPVSAPNLLAVDP